jgi:RHS repeat-associated protein
VTYVSVGTCTLTASATATANYTAVTGSAQSFTVNPATPTISISNMPGNGSYAGSFTVMYSYTGNGSPTVSSSTPGVCTVSGNVVTNVGLGTCTLTASAPATTDYTAATGSAQSFWVYPDQPTISISDIPSNVRYSGYGVGFTVTYSYIGYGTPNGTPSVTSSTPSVCTVSGNAVTYLRVGTCTLQAAATATTYYTAPTSSPQSFVISQGISTASWGTPAPITYGTALSYAQLGASINVPGFYGYCTYSPASGTVLSTGTYTLTATCAPDDMTDYTTPAPLTETLVVNQAPLTVTAYNASRAYNASNPTFTSIYSGFVNGDTSSVVSGSPSYSTTATTSSPVGTYPITPGGGSLTAANYTPSSFVNGTLTINKATPTITWTPASIPYGTELGTVQLNAIFSAPGTCVYSPEPGTLLDVGTHTLSVTCWATDATDYNTPSNQTASITVYQSTPTIWVSNIPTDATYGGSLAVTFSYSGDGTPSVTSSTPSVCTVSGSTVNYVGIGTCALTASATGTTDSLAVTASAQSFPVSQPTPTIWIGNIPTDAVYPGSFTVAYSYSGTGSPTESVSSSTPSVCTASGATVSYVSTGICTLTASASGTTDYLAVTGDSQSFSILGTSLTPATIYSFNVPLSGGFDGVGNLTNYSDATYNGGSIMGTWSFQYDTLNRLASGSAATGTGPYAGQFTCWSYDAFGNRTGQYFSNQAFVNPIGASQCQLAGSATLLASDWNTYTVNGVDPGTNRVASTNARGITATPNYDAAGNVLNDGANYYSYDAEGRICAVQTSPSGPAYGYIYDAGGTRVAKGAITPSPNPLTQPLSCDPGSNGFQLTESYVLGPGGEELTQFSVANGVSTWQRTNVYGAGKQLATYDMVANPAYTPTNGQPAQMPALHFQLTDPLGTRRMQTSADGQPETYMQSLPFGDGLNTYPAPNYPATADDATPLHFTGKERDTESGNDYFDARYYSNAMGRFMSPDWSAKEEPVPYATMDDPQSLNLYSYVRNNPLVRTDPDGHCCEELVQQADQSGFEPFMVAAGVVTAAAAVWDNRDAIANGLQATASAYVQAGGPASTGMYPTTFNSDATDRGRANEGKGLAEVGATKNTTPSTTTDPKTGNEVTTIPDGKMPDGQHVEVKDTNVVRSTPQIRGQGQASVAESGKKPILVTGTKTKVSKSVDSATGGTHIVVRTPKLGPQQ